MLGPIGFTQPDPPGILVRGFEHEGTMNVPWHFPSYERLVTAAGFAPHTDYLSGYVDRTMTFPAELVPFATRVERLSVRYESFAEEFSSILQRQSHADEQ